MTIETEVETTTPETKRPGNSRAWLLWLARRIGLAALTLWLVSILVFFATAALGDPVRAILGKDYGADKARREQLEGMLNTHEPLIERYFSWLGHLLTGDAGRSIANATNDPVTSLIGPRVVNTFFLVAVAFIITIPVAFGIAMISSAFRRRWPDSAIQGVLLTLAGIPEFVIALILVAVFSTLVFHWFAPGFIGDERPWQQPSSMVLPVATLVLAVAPYVARIVRATLLEVLDSDYVELARLKGIPESVVMRKHALLNAIVPGIQVIALQLAWLAGGVVVVESVFSYPGIGKQLVDSVTSHDVPMVQALAMIIAAVYVVVNLIADIVSILLTPRARTAITS